MLRLSDPTARTMMGAILFALALGHGSRASDAVESVSMAAAGSRCIAMARVPAGPRPPSAWPARYPAATEAPPRIERVAFLPLALAPDEVRITYVTHATFRIETAAGVVIVTDYAGVAGEGRPPDIATMNHAHETHYTDTPDPRIPHVLRGWNPDGGPAVHALKLGDVYVRNVPTDIRSWDGGRQEDGNSIFIFEAANLCIGHLGHLHHELAPEDLAVIGQLDIVMAPVDGTWTLPHDAMRKVLKTLKARLVIPMHAFGRFTLERFLTDMSEEFEVIDSDERTITVTAATLPDKPTIRVMPESIYWSFE